MSAVEPWGQFEHDPRVSANADLRASDVDRGIFESVLAEAFASGRISREEYDERVDTVLASRTLGELMPLVADLPEGRLSSPGVLARSSGTEKDARALEAYRVEKRNAVWSLISASVICWAIWFATGTGFPWPLFVMLGTGLNAGRVMFQKQEILASERRKLEKKERKALEPKDELNED